MRNIANNACSRDCDWRGRFAGAYNVLMMRTFLTAFAFVFLLAGGDVRASTIHPLTLIPSAKPVVGDHVPASELSGKPVVVTFFASWCPPCTDEFKAMNQVRAEFPAEDVTLVAVNLFERWGGKDNPLRMKRFLKRTKPQFPLVKGTKKIAKAFGNITRIPSLVVYDHAGKEVWRFIHLQGATKMSATAEEIASALKSALAQGS